MTPCLSSRSSLAYQSLLAAHLFVNNVCNHKVRYSYPICGLLRLTCMKYLKCAFCTLVYYHFDNFISQIFKSKSFVNN